MRLTTPRLYDFSEEEDVPRMPAATETERVSPETNAEIAAALVDADGQGLLDLGSEVVVVKEKRKRGASKPKTPKKTKVGGLQMYPEEPIPAVGTVYNSATGEKVGIFHWITEVERAVALLDHWADNQFWVAFDLETSAAWREIPDMLWEPADGQTEADRPLIQARRPFKLDKDKWKEDEPYGSDAWTSVIFLCQCSVEDGVSVLFDMRTLMKSERFMSAFRRMVTTCPLVGQNCLFDCTFIITQFGVYPRLAFDTALAHRMVTAGSVKGSDMGSLARKYRGIQLDKGWQKQWLSMHPESPIPLEAIRYAAGDVLFLLDVAYQIAADLERLEQAGIWYGLEQPMMFWIQRARQIGMRIDTEAMGAIQQEIDTQVAAAEAQLATIMPGVNPQSQPQLVKWFTDQGVVLPTSKSGAPSTDEKALNKLITTAKKPEVKAAAEGILDVRKVKKVKSTYIDPLLVDHRVPLTGHAHSQWNQNEAETGRMSSEGPNLQNIPMRDPRFAIIRDAFVAPADIQVWIDAKTREFLGVADPNLAVAYSAPYLDPAAASVLGAFRELWEMSVITEDYSQYEVRALADMSGEPKMLSVFDESYDLGCQLREYCRENGLVFRLLGGLKEAFDEWTKAVGDQKAEKAAKYEAEAQEWLAISENHPTVVELLKRLKLLDFHTQTAAQLFCDGDVTKVTKEQRTAAKTVNFGIPYGRGAQGIAEGVKVDLDAAQKILDRYFEVYRSVKRWLDMTMALVEKQGYTETVAGRKRFYPLQTQQEIYQDLIQTMESPDEADQNRWLEWTKKWRTDSPGMMARKMYQKNLKEAQRQAVNAPIQGNNADATKSATIIVGPRLYRLNPLCSIVMWVHDEIVSVAPKHLAEEAAEIQMNGMIEGAKLWVKRCPIEVSCAIGPRWQK